MNLFRRHIGRRVAGVGVGVALLMLGLEAPAFAAAPTIASFTPTSGPDNCIVAVTGTAFTDSPAAATTIDFVVGATIVNAPDFTIQTATEIWVRVPNLAEGTSYNIKITNNGGPATSSGSFLSTTGVGGCAPTITDFTPKCGSTDTTVKITGTNLLVGTDPTVLTQQTPVNFFDYTGAAATHTLPNSDTPTNLSVFVPSGSKDGPIRVTTFDLDLSSSSVQGGVGFSTAPFQVPPPDCTAALPFARSITLRLRDALVARGKVSASLATAPAGCTAGVAVKIQRRRPGGAWRTVGSTTTSDTGAYRKKIRNRHGKYRSLAPKLTLASGDVCGRDVSNVVRH